jgi:hypothetical protein
VGWSGSGECLLLQLHVGVQVDLGGLDADVSEPERDDAGVDAGVQQPHRGGVSQHVRGDRLAAQGWAGCCGVVGVVRDAVLDGVAAQWSTATGGEQRIAGLAVVLVEPVPEDGDRAAGEWGDPVLAAFPALCRSVGNAESRLPLTALLLLCLLCAI